MVSPSRLAFAGAFFLSSLAFAQTPELDRARATFTEALADQDARRYDVALEKFRHVAEVRDTAQVEYRIGACLEALGQRRAALVAYDHAAHLGRGDAQAQDVVASANEHIAALAADMSKLGVVVRGSDAAEVRVDGAPVATDELAAALVLEPGEHVVDVTAPRMKPARATVNLVRGKRLDLTVDLVAEAAPPVAPPTTRSHARQNAGVALVVTGVAFAAGAGVSLFVRSDLISTIKSDCAGATSPLVCPSSMYNDIEGMRSTANTLAPLAAIFGGVALAAVGVGVVLVALGPQTRVSAFVAPSESGAAFTLWGVF